MKTSSLPFRRSSPLQKKYFLKYLKKSRINVKKIALTRLHYRITTIHSSIFPRSRQLRRTNFSRKETQLRRTSQASNTRKISSSLVPLAKPLVSYPNVFAHRRWSWWKWSEPEKKLSLLNDLVTHGPRFRRSQFALSTCQWDSNDS